MVVVNPNNNDDSKENNEENGDSNSPFGFLSDMFPKYSQDKMAKRIPT